MLLVIAKYKTLNILQYWKIVFHGRHQTFLKRPMPKKQNAKNINK